MKKATLLILFLSICCNAKSQQQRFIGGLLFNLNGMGLLGDTGHYWNSSTENDGEGHGGISCGLFVKREFTKNIYSTLEVRYSTKGSFYGFISQYGTKTSESLYLNYIELPVLIGYKFKPLKTSYYVECGIEFSKLIHSRIENNEQLSRIGTPNVKDFKNTDISMSGSVKFPLIRKWQENFLLGIRLTRSIQSIHKYSKIYNFEYGIELNYLFN